MMHVIAQIVLALVGLIFQGDFNDGVDWLAPLGYLFIFGIFFLIVYSVYKLGKVKQDQDHLTDDAKLRSVKEVKETIVRKVVMIPCQNCYGLMPKTAAFCPRCGVKKED